MFPPRKAKNGYCSDPLCYKRNWMNYELDKSGKCWNCQCKPEEPSYNPYHVRHWLHEVWYRNVITEQYYNGEMEQWEYSIEIKESVERETEIRESALTTGGLDYD